MNAKAWLGARRLVVPALLMLTCAIPSASGASATAGCQSPTLAAVAATSSSNAWAVGSCQDDGQNLIEHWDGNTWSEQATPTIGQASGLAGVAATSATNAWAVGWYMLSDGTTLRTLIEHWDGSTWTVQSSPNPYALKSEPWAELAAIVATSPTNAWAVGHVGGPYALIEHWNGSAWTSQRSPRNICCWNGVAATSSRSALVAGSAFYLGAGGRTAHWNGRSWKLQPVPRNGSEFDGVAVAASNQAWEVGPGIVLRWDGRHWKRQRTPLSARITLQGVVTTSRSGAWAVGVEGPSPRGPFGDVGVIEHWDGHRWTIQFTTPGIRDASFAGVAATSSTNAWAVGTDQGAALIEHWDGTAWVRQTV